MRALCIGCRRRWVCVFLLVYTLAGCSGPENGGAVPKGGAQLSENDLAQIRAALPRAASISLEQFDQLSAETNVHTLGELKDESLPLTMLMMLADPRRIDIDAAALKNATPNVSPVVIANTLALSLDEGFASIVHDTLIRDLKCKRVGDVVQCIVHFTLLNDNQILAVDFIATPIDGQWEINEFSLPSMSLTTKRSDDGRWKATGPMLNQGRVELPQTAVAVPRKDEPRLMVQLRHRNASDRTLVIDLPDVSVDLRDSGLPYDEAMAPDEQPPEIEKPTATQGSRNDQSEKLVAKFRTAAPNPSKTLLVVRADKETSAGDLLRLVMIARQAGFHRFSLAAIKRDLEDELFPKGFAPGGVGDLLFRTELPNGAPLTRGDALEVESIVVRATADASGLRRSLELGGASFSDQEFMTRLAKLSGIVNRVTFSFDNALSIEESAKVLSLVAASLSKTGELASSEQPDFFLNTQPTMNEFETDQIIGDVVESIHPEQVEALSSDLDAIDLFIERPASRHLTLKDETIIKRYPPIDIVVLFDDRGDSAQEFRLTAAEIPYEMERVRRCGIDLAMNVGFCRRLPRNTLFDRHQDLANALHLSDGPQVYPIEIGIDWAANQEFRKRSLRFILICGDIAPDEKSAAKCVFLTKRWRHPNQNKSDGRLSTLSWGDDQPFAAFQQMADAGHGVAGAAKRDTDRIVPGLFKLVFGESYETDIATIEKRR